MLLALLAAALLSARAAAEPLSDRIDREYVQPALAQVQGALDGREPSWIPPVLPGSAQAARLSERVRARWLEPLLEGNRSYALDAARTLASPRAFEVPAEPDVAALLPDARVSPAAEELVSGVERRFLARLFPEDYALGAAAALGSGRAGEEGPSAPEQEEPARPPDDARFARPRDFGRKRKVADSTRLTRGSAGAGPAPRLKPARSRFSAAP